MEIGNKSADTLFANLTIRLCVGDKALREEDGEVLCAKADNLIDEIEEVIRLYVVLPKEFSLATER